MLEEARLMSLKLIPVPRAALLLFAPAATGSMALAAKRRAARVACACAAVSPSEACEGAP